MIHGAIQRVIQPFTWPGLGDVCKSMFRVDVSHEMVYYACGTPGPGRDFLS